MNIRWEVNTAKYANGKILYLGKWRVGQVFWDSCTTNKDLRYAILCSLPGLKSKFENKETEELAMKRLEFIVKYWLDQI